ncbi:MAG: hypothetical protein ACFFC7_18460 [Candidatus Hermodarchaeota archaeon]
MLVTLVYAFVYTSIIFLAVVVLTYEPTKVYDVLLLNKTAGVPIATHIELFQSDEVLISGFFTAISNVSGQLDAEPSEVQSIKRGEREIIIEEGVLTRIIALVNKDQPLIRRSIAEMQKQFEIKVDAEKVERWTGQKNA